MDDSVRGELALILSIGRGEDTGRHEAANHLHEVVCGDRNARHPENDRRVAKMGQARELLETGLGGNPL